MKDKHSLQTVAKNRRFIIMLICILMCTFIVMTFISAGDTNYADNTKAKTYILENHTEQTGAENAVTAVYLNYRLWDTIFESMLLLLSALAVISFSWSADDEK